MTKLYYAGDALFDGDVNSDVSNEVGKMRYLILTNKYNLLYIMYLIY